LRGIGVLRKKREAAPLVHPCTTLHSDILSIGSVLCASVHDAALGHPDHRARS
jgi:hypothetical protein